MKEFKRIEEGKVEDSSKCERHIDELATIFLVCSTHQSQYYWVGQFNTCKNEE
jgi:hypothetical protein